MPGSRPRRGVQATLLNGGTTAPLVDKNPSKSLRPVANALLAAGLPELR